VKVVANTTPIISLASIGRLDLLERLFGHVLIAEAVYRELKAKPSYGYAQVDCPFIEVRPIQGRLYKPLLLNQLDAGEAETILLAQEINADFVIIDENIGYRFATSAGLTVVRTLSLLLRAKDKGYIEQVAPLLDEMIAKGRWYSETVRRAVLERAGESG
jgi:uncharacterized protein